ncbi:hypothetical protein CABS03_07391 [Colletotrichum abscissum]|uniref:Uncharacterized protein n=1 Tax=Colletotrichum abscissum TaxID=1671311 RepID=A0A9P9XRH6_9PEZI|nr:hypothetical protein CABS02_00047 [Colletotrichum abscissum]
MVWAGRIVKRRRREWGCKFTSRVPQFRADDTRDKTRHGRGDEHECEPTGDVRRRMEVGRRLYLRRQEAVKWH